MDWKRAKDWVVTVLGLSLALALGKAGEVLPNLFGFL
jgi:hypothetical protein